MDTKELAANLLVILAELGFLIVLYAVLTWLIDKTWKRLGRIAWVQQKQNRAQNIQKNCKRILKLSVFTCCILVVGTNGVLLYQGENLWEYNISLIGKIPPGFWLKLSRGILLSIGALIAAALTIRFLLNPALEWAVRSLHKFESLMPNEAFLDESSQFIKKSLTKGIWLWSAVWCARFLGLPAIVNQYLSIALRIYLIITAGLLFLRVCDTIVDRLDTFINEYSSSHHLLRFYDRLKPLIPFLKLCIDYGIYIFTATLALQQIPVPSLALLLDYGPKIVAILGIICISRVSSEVTSLAVEEALLQDKSLTELQTKRRLTIVPLLQRAVKYAIYFGAGIAILKAVEVDPTPILAGAGILGVVVGLGTQNLINDMVCGFFILFENYYLVGDSVEIGEARGIVEAIDLRTTSIRHWDGQVYIMRNGDIGGIINYSRDYLYAIVNVGVAYESNLDRVYAGNRERETIKVCFCLGLEQVVCVLTYLTTAI